MFHALDLNKLIAMIVPLLFAVTIHEVAHGWVAYRLGDPTAKWSGRLTLNPVRHLDPMGSIILPLVLFLVRSPVLFGYAKPVPVNFNNLADRRRGMILVGLAGAAANVLCACLSGLLHRAVWHLRPWWDGSVLSTLFSDLAGMLEFSVVINVILAILNMVPIPPLDGGRVLAGILPPAYEPRLARIERFGIVIFLFLLFSHYLDWLLVPLMQLLVNLFLVT